MWPADVRAIAPGALRVVAVFAHPDDETLFAGATLASLCAGGASVTLVTCTSGEGCGRAPTRRTLRTDAAVGAVRRRELAGACADLGVEDHVLLGGGRWRDSGREPERCRLPGVFARAGQEAVADLVEVLEARDPHVVVTFEAGGITGHPDHRRACRLVQEALSRYRSPSGRDLPSVWGALVPQSWVAAGVGLLARLGDAAGPQVGSGGLRGYAAGGDVTVPAGAFVRHKRAALARYTSQVPGGSVRAMLARSGRRGDTLLLCAIAEALGDAWGLEHFVVETPVSAVPC